MGNGWFITNTNHVILNDFGYSYFEKHSFLKEAHNQLWYSESSLTSTRVLAFADLKLISRKLLNEQSEFISI